MSPRTWRERLEDILICARNIKSFTAGMSFDAFLDDPRTIRAVAFEFTTMGEASRAIPKEIQEQHPEIPWGKMQGIRNVLVHVWCATAVQVGQENTGHMPGSPDDPADQRCFREAGYLGQFRNKQTTPTDLFPPSRD